jgi:putative endonuclease
MSATAAAAEQLAADYLQRQGLCIVARNYRCRFGEIDLVARHGETLVFVEVRLRTSTRFGGAAASITSNKRRKLLRAARHYLRLHATGDPCRFDVVLLSALRPASINWIENAFGE